MRAKLVVSIAILPVVFVMTGFVGRLAAQQHTVQSTAPSLTTPAQAVTPSTPAGAPAQKSSTGETIEPVKAAPPAASPDPADAMQVADPMMGRQLTPAEIEELKDGK